MMKTVFALVLVAFISSTKTLAASNTIRGSDTVVLDEIGEEFGRSSSTELGKIMMMTTERKLRQQRRGLDVGGISSEFKKKREKGGERDTRTKLTKKENVMTTERKLQQQRRGLGVGGISSEFKKKREKGGEKDTRTKLTKKENVMTTERKLQQQRRGLGVGGISSELKKKRKKGGEMEKDTRTKLTKKENESKSTKASGGPTSKDGKPSGGTWFKEPKASKNGKTITVKEGVTKDGKPYGATTFVKQKISKEGKFEKNSKDDGSVGAKPVSPYGPW
jgi:hypothetical protein